MSSEKIKELVASYLATKDKLRSIDSSFNWSNLVGDYGEYVAIKNYNLKQAMTGTKGFDATNTLNKTVQIKTIRATTKSIKFSDGADYLLVLRLWDDASWEEIYYGSMEKVKKYISYPTKNGEYTVNLTKLIQISKNTAKPKETLSFTIKGKLIEANDRRSMIKQLQLRGINVPGESTINARIRKGWSEERAFGLKVPPKYQDYEKYVEDEGYLWFPNKPVSESDNKPLLSDFEKRIYLTQKDFCREHEIPEWYFSQHKEDWDLPRIIVSYRETQKNKK
ncbi:hypothetical protein N9C18_00900 [Planktomarina temperata]|nr:hypothetical protein [Planktomarina temperata]